MTGGSGRSGEYILQRLQWSIVAPPVEAAKIEWPLTSQLHARSCHKLPDPEITSPRNPEYACIVEICPVFRLAFSKVLMSATHFNEASFVR